VSVLSFGSWLTFGGAASEANARDCLAAAYEAGINFFDNAESYAGGESERVMGRAIAELGWPRWSYVISTKLYWGIRDAVNMSNTLNRKYLLQAIDGSLERLGLDFVDLVYCHRPDPDTPVEETVWAMSDIIASGKALYWGTSEWSASEIEAAWKIADRHHLHKPVVEQPEYHLFHRERVEVEYDRLYDTGGLGLTTYSPLAYGLLTGKYVDGVPNGSRATADTFSWVRERVLDQQLNERVRQLLPLAASLDCTMAQLAIAWCVKNPRVSTVITGASSVAQLRENLEALRVVPELSAERLTEIDRLSADAVAPAFSL
jgi:voltage-dependent potassium channel beta subunit